MTADDMLDQEHWQSPVDLPHLLVEHGAAVAELRRRRLSVDQAIRAVALQAAATWLTGESPYRQGREFVLDTADVFAQWIEGGSQRCSSPGSGPESRSTVSNPTPRYADTAQTGEEHTA